MSEVDLTKFMGRWYVIANIPTFIEKDAYSAVETYSMGSDGQIDTVFTFREGGFDGEMKRYTSTAFVTNDPSNAIWGMQFIWPFKADYRIVYLDSDYTQTVIGREARDYVWIMARKPILEKSEYNKLLKKVATAGYDITEVKLVPQNPQ